VKMLYASEPCIQPCGICAGGNGHGSDGLEEGDGEAPGFQPNASSGRICTCAIRLRDTLLLHAGPPTCQRLFCVRQLTCWSKPETKAFERFGPNAISDGVVCLTGPLGKCIGVAAATTARQPTPGGRLVMG
jgi:hypothetical protein